MKEDKIQLVNEKNEPVYQRHIKGAASEGATTKSVDQSALEEPVSPDIKESKSKLVYICVFNDLNRQ
jgi:hypothetical protein